MYRTATKKRNSTEDYMAEQIDFAKKKGQKFNVKKCAVCGNEYERKKYMSDKKWKDSRVCGKVCSGKFYGRGRNCGGVKKAISSALPHADAVKRKESAVELDSVAGMWDQIKIVLDIHGVSEKGQAMFKKYYDLGFKHGEASTRG